MAPVAGFPVVLSDTGAPFIAVTSAAPLATVATNGLGAPIRLTTHNAPPLIVQGLVPPEEPVEFQIYTGSGNNGDIGYYSTVYGSVENQPMPGFPLLEFASRNSGYFQVSFRGDVASNLAGYYPVIDGFNIGTLESDWTFDGTYTTATWTGGDTLSVNTLYTVTWANEAPELLLALASDDGAPLLDDDENLMETYSNGSTTT